MQRIPRLVPLWATLRETIVTTWLLRHPLFAISWPWLLIIFVASGVGAWMQLPPPGEHDKLPRIAVGAVVTFATASMAIGWHRLILLKEKPAATYLRSDLLVLKYAGLIYASQLIGWPLLQLTSAMQQVLGAFGFAAIMTILGLAIIAVLFRLSLLLPALATGRIDGAFAAVRHIWTGTRGNTWRLFVGYIAIGLLMLIPFVIAHQLAAAHLGFTLTVAVIETLQALLGMLFVTFASLCYWQLFEPED